MELTNQIDNVQWQSLSDEIDRGIRKFGHFNTFHEGYAVLLEEVDELWEQIKKKDAVRVHLSLEARQIAACALRFAQQVENGHWPGSLAEDGT